MRSLGSHYTKYARLGAHTHSLREICAQVVSDAVGVSVSVDVIRVKDGVLEVTLPAPAKMRLRESKREVLQLLRKKVGTSITNMV